MKKTLNQLKASRRNLSLMLLAGMITNLKHIKHFVKEDNIYSKDTILSCIRSELVELYRISKQQQIRTSDRSTYKARIYITSNPEREEPYLCIINCYINDIYYIDRSIKRIELILINCTISNTIYTIRCHFGYKETKFKYKHE